MCLPNAAKKLHARAGQMAVQAVGLFLDYLKNRVTDETLKLLVPGLESREEPALAHDSSTNNLNHRYRKLKEAS